MKSLLPLHVGSFLLLVYVLFPLSVHAAGSCTETPDFKSPLVSQLFTKDNMETKDCGIYPEDSQLQKDNLDYGTVRCLDKPELIAQLIGDNPDLIKKTGAGRASLDIKDNANLALGSDTLLANQSGLLPYLMAIQMASQGDRQIAAACYAQGITDPNQCANALGLSICDSNGNCRLNTFQYPQSSRITPPKEQLLEIRQRALNHLDCTDGTVPTDKPCDNIFYYDDAGDKNSRVLAQFIVDNISVDHPLETYSALSDDDQLKVKSLMESKASEKYWIVIKKIRDPNSFYGITGFLAKLLGQDQEIFIIPRYLPSLPHIYDTALARYRKVQPLGRGDQIVSDLKKSLYEPVNHNQSVNAQILEKIASSGVTCSSGSTESQLSQFMGAVAPAGPDRPAIMQWFFNILGAIKESPSHPMYVYEIYTIVPYQLQVLAQIEGENPQSIERLFYPLSAGQGFNQKINIPQPVNAEAPAAETDPSVNSQPCLSITDGVCQCPSGFVPVNNDHCQKPADDKLVFSDSALPQTFIPGGESIFLRWLYSQHKRFQSLIDKDYMSETCQYYRGLSLLSPNLSPLLGSAIIPFTTLASSCPAPPNNTNINTNNSGDVCTIADKYHIPCCYLQAIQRIESGCDPNTSGNNTCDGFSCCNSSCNCGPMQVGSNLYSGLANGQNLNMCALNDSTELAARLMIRQRCQGWGNLCQRGLLSGEKCAIADKYQCTDNYNWNPAMLNEPLLEIKEGDEDVLSYYYGTCEPEPGTIGRGWGNVGYCDAVLNFCQGKLAPGLSCP